MKVSTLSVFAALTAERVTGHATFQALWVGGVDKGSCARTPSSNSPVTDVKSSNIRCNAGGGSGVAGKCIVAAGTVVTVEMHQQPGDRSCANEAIGGAHYGPVMAYLSKVSDSSSTDGSGSWFKIFQDGWSKVTGSSAGDNDNWGTKDLNKCCGKMNVKIPADIAPGDYLLRAEAIALHTAGGNGGAQFYMTCYQLTVTGGGSANPSGVSFPGAYSASDPGILVNIHAALSNYVVPGPAVYSGGSTKSAGSGCSGAEAGTSTGPAAITSTTLRTSTAAAPGGASTTSGSTGGGCSVAKYGQCGGDGYTGCKTCASGATCSGVSAPFYSQCL